MGINTEGLIQYLEDKIKRYDDEINATDIASYEKLMKCHKLACKVEAYNDVIRYIKVEQRIAELKEM